MRHTTIAAVALVLVAMTDARASKPVLIFGPLRLGMTYEETRAALPTAKWTPMTYGPAWNPQYSPRFPYDHEMRSLTAKDAVTAGGEIFDIEYEDATWNRYRLSATTRDEAATNPEPCAKRIFRVMEEIEKWNGPLAAPEADKSGQLQQLRMAVGKKSQALMTMHRVQGFTLSAFRKAGDASIEISGGTPGASNGGNQLCHIDANFKIWPERPPAGSLAFDALKVRHEIGIGAKHHSLDKAPAELRGIVDVPLECTIESNGTLTCNETQDIAAGAKPFVPAAKFRIRDMRVARRTHDGRWTAGEKTKLVLKVAPEDRKTVNGVDLSKSALLVLTERVWAPTRYPDDAIDPGISATVQFGCVVQTDGSPVCPDITVEPGTKFDNDFIAAALSNVLFTRYAPRLTNGESSAGVGFRMEYGFKID